MHDAGRGGTGELVVPAERFSSIPATDFSDVAVERPSDEDEIPASRPTTAPSEVGLTIEQVRQMALANNLDLKVELLGPAIAWEGISEEEAAFESTFTTDLRYTRLDTPSVTQLEGTQVENWSLTPGITVPLRGGGTVRLQLPLTRSENNNSFQSLNPAYTSDASASISIPLLRDAGVETSSQRIRVAFYEFQRSAVLTRLQVIRVLANADRAYWRLYAAEKALEVRKREFELAEAQLERARRQVEAGVSAEVEIIRAESGVADRVEAIIRAENDFRDRQRELKRILNEPILDLSGPTQIRPTSPPRAVPYAFDIPRLIKTARQHRMELLDAELRIALQTSNVAFARNQMLPLVTLEYRYTVNGLGPHLDDSLDMTVDKDFEDHEAAFRVSVPLGNEAARSRLRTALARRQQELATRDQRDLQIRQEVLNAVDQLESSWQSILSSQKRVLLNARLLEAETRQFALGLRTSTEVLDAQTRLATAQTDEIRAVAEYQIARIDLAYACGLLLGASGVSWEPIRLERNP
jgi:outer membrane protein TolC